MRNRPIVLFDIDYTLFDTEYFKNSGLKKHKIYKEVKDVLKKLKRIANLGIFSEGNLKLQIKKLEKTGIKYHFKEDNTHIVFDKLNVLQVLEKYKNRRAFFIDDKLSILYHAKKLFPDIFTIWVKRGFYAENQKNIPGFKPDAEVENLSEIVTIINSKL